MKPWMRRLLDLEKKSSYLYANDHLDQWIKENIQNSEFTYFDIMFSVPDHLKMICLDKALKQLRELKNQSR